MPEANDPAFEVVLACTRLELTEADRARITGLLAAGCDWQRVHALADMHGLRPLLFRHLGDGTFGKLPQETEAKLWRHSEQLRRRNVEMETELLRLTDALEAAGIDVLVHKGPVVARLAYRSAELREYGDLDLLLPLAAVTRARVLLESLGYRSKFPMAPAVEAAFLEAPGQYHLMLAHEGHGMLVELHWRTDAEFVVEGMSVADWWQRLPRIEILGRALARLPDEDLVLALCLHGSKHYWGSLHWLMDVAELLRRLEPMAWSHMVARAVALRAERRLALGIVLLREHLGVEPPPDVAAWSRACAPVNALAWEIACRWRVVDAPPHSATRRLRLDFALYDEADQRIRYLFRTVFRPGVVEWSRWPLPRGLHFLYGPLRLAGLVQSAFRRARGPFRKPA